MTTLHEAYPQQQHPTPYPFDAQGLPTEPTTPPVSEDLLRSADEQRRRFGKLVDRIAMVDLTPPEEGFNDPEYGGPRLRQELLEVLPAAVGQTLRTLDEATHELQDLYAQEAMPHIIAYSSLAASAGAVPIPVLDLVLLSGIQSRMIYHLARHYGQPMDAKGFLEIAGGAGLGVLARQATRMTVVELLKLIPFVGSVAGAVAGAALAWASTYAAGQGFLLLLPSGSSGTRAADRRPEKLLQGPAEPGGTAVEGHVRAEGQARGGRAGRGRRDPSSSAPEGRIKDHFGGSPLVPKLLLGTGVGEAPLRVQSRDRTRSRASRQAFPNGVWERGETGVWERGEMRNTCVDTNGFHPRLFTAAPPGRIKDHFGGLSVCR